MMRFADLGGDNQESTHMGSKADLSLIRSDVAKPRTIKNLSPDTLWLRRQALQLAAQLPESEADARAVVRMLGELINDFTYKDEQQG